MIKIDVYGVNVLHFSALPAQKLVDKFCQNWSLKLRENLMFVCLSEDAKTMM